MPKISKWVEFSTEVEIDIGEEDIIEALACSGDTPKFVINGMNMLARFTRSITDEIIDQLTQEQRKLIGDWLSMQADRYKTQSNAQKEV